VEIESSYVSEIRFPGPGAVRSADAAQAPGQAVTALYRAHAVSLTRLAYVMLGDRPVDGRQARHRQIRHVPRTPPTRPARAP